MYERMLATYEQLEPEGADAWNPLGNELELWHRVRLFHELRAALRALSVPIEQARILDVGCGVGRSTRALLEFGARPENVLGIDLREAALAHARALNPAIPVRVVRACDDWRALGHFDLVMQCTAFSSMDGAATRVEVAQQMAHALRADGRLFWWDSRWLHPLAGEGALDPRALFAPLRFLRYRHVALRPSFAEVSPRVGPLLDRGFALVRRLIGAEPTHCAALFAPRDTAP